MEEKRKLRIDTNIFAVENTHGRISGSSTIRIVNEINCEENNMTEPSDEQIEEIEEAIMEVSDKYKDYIESIEIKYKHGNN